MRTVTIKVHFLLLVFVALHATGAASAKTAVTCDVRIPAMRCEVIYDDGQKCERRFTSVRPEQKCVEIPGVGDACTCGAYAGIVSSKKPVKPDGEPALPEKPYDKEPPKVPDINTHVPVGRDQL